MDTALNSQTVEQKSDIELVERARTNDRDAFDELFVMHKPFIYNVCFRMLGSAEDAVDATQNAFIQAFNGLKSFRGGAAFRTWLYRIAVNECNAILRQRRVRNLLPLGSDVPEKRDTGGDRVWEAVLELPGHLRAVLVLFYFQQLSCGEAAQALGCSEGAVRVRLHRAREAFRRKYEELDR